MKEAHQIAHPTPVLTHPHLSQPSPRSFRAALGKYIFSSGIIFLSGIISAARHRLFGETMAP
jgi:hypothetical protein